MIILKDMPGLTTRDLLDLLGDISPGAKHVTGHGGFVVSERTAYEVLRAYLMVTGEIQEPTPEPEPEPDVVVEEPRRRNTRRTTKGGSL